MDRIPMVNVTARILDQNGKPVAGARITMRLSTVERYCGLIVPRETSQYTDANGNATLRVWPNELGTEGSEYMVTIGYGDACSSPCGRQGTLPPSMSQRFRVVVPNADCNLFDITDLPPYEQRGSGQVITAEVAAFASQAGNAADRAQNAVETVAAIRAETEEIARTADSAKSSALEAAREAQGSERRTRVLVDGFDSTVSHFQNAVVEQTEKTANRLVANATACIKQAETVALDAMESRSGEVLNEISERGSQVQKAAVEAVNNSRETALAEIDGARKKSLEDLREEAELFGEDFEALTERAESAAKRAGCSAAASANSATKACLCADRAEKAADDLDQARADAIDAANKAKADHACAHADAICAANAATAAHLDAGKAEAAATSSEKSAEMSDCCARRACKCADTALEISNDIEEDKQYIDQAVPKVVTALEEKEGRLAGIEKRQDEADASLDNLEKYASEYERRMREEILRAQNTLSVARGRNFDAWMEMAEGAKAGDIIELPVFYIVGRNMLLLNWGGMAMGRGRQFEEVGHEEDISKKIRLLIDIPANSTLGVWVATPHVTGDLLEAEKKAAEIIDNLAGAQDRVDAEIGKLRDTLDIISTAGDRQVERAQDEVKRARDEADRASEAFAKTSDVLALTQGSNLDASLLVSEPIEAGRVIDIPVQYAVGRAALRVFWGGFLMGKGLQYEEVGERNSVSGQIRLLIDIPARAELIFWSVCTGLANAGELADEAARMEKKLDGLAAAVDSQVERFAGEGQAVLDAAKTSADRAEAAFGKTAEVLKLAQGVNSEAVILLQNGMKAGERLELPMSYIVGRAALRMHWGGFLMSSGVHYEELGEAETISRQIKILIDLPKDAALNAWSVSTCATNGELQEKISLAVELLAKAREVLQSAEEARDKALEAIGAAANNGITTVPSEQAIDGRPDGFFIIDPDMEENTQG